MIVDRIREVIKHTGLSERAFCREIGASHGFLGKVKSIGSDKLEKIVVRYPEINPDWLLKGEGEMLRSTKEKVNGTAVESRLHSDNRKGNRIAGERIPLLPIQAVAGFGGMEFTVKKHDIEELYEVPDFAGASFLVRVKGPSMAPTYNPGDLVACRVIRESTFIQWGKAYLIDTTEQGALIKRLEEGESGGLLAISDNPKFKPFEIPKEEVRGLALVMGVLRLE